MTRVAADETRRRKSARLDRQNDSAEDLRWQCNFLVKSLTRLLPTLVCAALATFGYLTVAASKDVDLRFSPTGKIMTAVGGGNANAQSIAVQRDGKIVVAGVAFAAHKSDFALVRYNTDGSLDRTFNRTGKVTTTIGGAAGANSVAMQRDGKIVLAGYSTDASKQDFALTRYNADGTLDTSFNNTGKVTCAVGTDKDQARSVAVQSDGKIVVAGHSSTDRKCKFALVRYNTDGTLDTTFNSTGKVTTAIGSGKDDGYCVALQTDGKILVAGNSFDGNRGYEFALVRYNTDGSLDTSFNGTGKVTTIIGRDGSADSVAVQSDGKIVLAGSCFTGRQSAFALARYNTDGSLDTSFNGTGTLTTDIGGGDAAHSVTVQSDGKIVVAGSTTVGNANFALVRYNADGSLDATFHGTGKVTTVIGSSHNLGYIGSGVALQSDGKILVTGYSFNTGRDYFALVRYNTNGGLDTKAQQRGKADHRHRPRPKRAAN